MGNDWKKISEDPNSNEVKKQILQKLKKARSKKYITNRGEYICSLVSGKRVLDVGIADHTKDAYKSQNWLHRLIAKSAKDCLGVDILEEHVERIRDQGYNVILHDLTLNPIHRRFEVIVCGEVLEHVDNPTALLKNIASMLEHDGFVIFTVPNPWYMNCFAKNIFADDFLLESADHVAWYDPQTLLALGNRHGLDLIRFTGVLVTKGNTVKMKILKLFFPILVKIGFKYELFSKTMVYEFTKVSTR